MSCIHYKFRSALEYDTITFDGLSISLADLKHSIITQKKFGKSTDFDLEVTNAQTKESKWLIVKYYIQDAFYSSSSHSSWPCLRLFKSV